MMFHGRSFLVLIRYPGAFGRVYEASWEGVPIAAKIMNPTSNVARKAGIPSSVPSASSAIGMNSLVHEIHIFSKLAEVQHPNIVSFIGACSLGANICLCTEFIPGGSLFAFLHQTDHP